MKEPFQTLIMQAIKEIGIEDNSSKDQTLQLFAELIVKECIERLRQEGRLGTIQLVAQPYPLYKFAAMYDAANILQDHFGIDK
jgi:hypothetical protein